MKTWPRMAFVTAFVKNAFEDPQTDRGMLRRCAVAAVWLTLCVFPDVIFLHASLSNTSLVNVTSDDGRKRVQLFPERKIRQAYEGFSTREAERSSQSRRRSSSGAACRQGNPSTGIRILQPAHMVRRHSSTSRRRRSRW